MISYSKDLEVLSHHRRNLFMSDLETMLYTDAADLRGSRKVFLARHSPTIIITYGVCTSNRKEPDIPTDYKEARSNFIGQLDWPHFTPSTEENSPKGTQWHSPQTQAEPESHKSQIGSISVTAHHTDSVFSMVSCKQSFKIKNKNYNHSVIYYSYYISLLSKRLGWL